MPLTPIRYQDLNSKQQEIDIYQKASAKFVAHGEMVDDFEGATPYLNTAPRQQNDSSPVGKRNQQTRAWLESVRL
ncbi:MAG: hypothetical protein RLO46_13145 [Pseudomonadales bacterium]